MRIRLSYFPSKRRESKESYSSYLTYLAPKLSLSGLLNLELKSSLQGSNRADDQGRHLK